MFERTVNEEDLDDLKQAREEADHAYNAALTVLDRALPARPTLPGPPGGDEGRFAALHSGRQLAPDDGPPFGSGWRAYLNRVAWHIIGPIVKRQQHFNRLVVEHLERADAVSAAQRQADDAAIAALGHYLDAITTFQSRLIQYSQQITPYVDTKDREATALMRRVTEDVAVQVDDLDCRLRALGDVDSLRTTVASLQREVLALRAAGAQAAASANAPAPPPEDAPRRPAPLQEPEGIDASLDAFAYVGFEDRYRGARESIRDRQRDYVPLFENAADVLDIGCGRGEFLDLLREAGIPARGVDANPEMVAGCRAQGLEAITGDALASLEALPDGALGGLFSAQVVEHLQPDVLVRLIRVAWRKLRPGSTIAIETINPSCWLAFFETYLRDFTHVKPLHPETLRYLLAAGGFHSPEIRFLAPIPEADRLQRLPMPNLTTEAPLDARLVACLRTVNLNVDRLNSLLFSSMDYAAVATRA